MPPSIKRLLSAVIVLSLINTSCTKDTLIEKSSSGNSPSLNHNSRNPASVTDKTKGTITGVIAPPEAKAVIYAYNDQFVSPAAYAEPDGSFRIERLRSGTYNVYIHPNNNQYRDFHLYKIKVNTGEITNVGIISIH